MAKTPKALINLSVGSNTIQAPTDKDFSWWYHEIKRRSATGEWFTFEKLEHPEVKNMPPVIEFNVAFRADQITSFEHRELSSITPARTLSLIGDDRIQ